MRVTHSSVLPRINTCTHAALSALTGRTQECCHRWWIESLSRIAEGVPPEASRQQSIEAERQVSLDTLQALGFRAVRSKATLVAAGHRRLEGGAWICPTIFQWYLALPEAARLRGRYLLAVRGHWLVLDRGVIFDSTTPAGAPIEETPLRHLALVACWRVWRIATPEASAFRAQRGEPMPAGTQA